MTNKELEKIYVSMPNSMAAEKIGVSVPTLLRKVDKAGIKRKGSGRPYNKNNRPVYISSCITSISKKCTVSAAGVFYLLLLDSRMVKNEWNGQSDVMPLKGDTDYFKELESLYENGFIGQWEINSGKIKTSIKNRKHFVLTEDEYMKCEV